jgi:hypothetical protein
MLQGDVGEFGWVELFEGVDDGGVELAVSESFDFGGRGVD